MSLICWEAWEIAGFLLKFLKIVYITQYKKVYIKVYKKNITQTVAYGKHLCKVKNI